MPFLRTDHWRSAIVQAPLAEVIRQGSMDSFPISLIADPGDHRFFADPFGLWHEDRLYVFVESYDYRTRRGVIDVLIHDRSLVLKERRTVLHENWHLSYPFVFRHEGEIYLLPEAHESGRLTLYRATNFPYGWERVSAFNFPIGAIDATPFFHAGRWWLFWTPPGTKAEKQSVLHIALAERLTGPWHDMGCFLRDRGGARPGGTPVRIGEKIWLPVQDCTLTYGGGIRFLEFTGFEHGRPKMTGGPALPIPSSVRKHYPDGMHTLSAAGDVTLLDVKRVGIGVRRHLMALRSRRPGARPVRPVAKRPV